MANLVINPAMPAGTAEAPARPHILLPVAPYKLARDKAMAVRLATGTWTTIRNRAVAQVIEKIRVRTGPKATALAREVCWMRRITLSEAISVKVTGINIEAPTLAMAEMSGSLADRAAQGLTGIAATMGAENPTLWATTMDVARASMDRAWVAPGVKIKIMEIKTARAIPSPATSISQDKRRISKALPTNGIAMTKTPTCARMSIIAATRITIETDILLTDTNTRKRTGQIRTRTCRGISAVPRLGELTTWAAPTTRTTGIDRAILEISTSLTTSIKTR